MGQSSLSFKIVLLSGVGWKFVQMPMSALWASVEARADFFDGAAEASEDVPEQAWEENKDRCTDDNGGQESYKRAPRQQTQATEHQAVLRKAERDVREWLG